MYISNDAASLKYYNFDVLYLNHAYDNIYAILMYLYNRIITLSLFVKSACREQYLMNESVFVWCNIGWKYIVDPKLCLHCWHAQVFLICYNLYSYKKGGGMDLFWIFSNNIVENQEPYMLPHNIASRYLYLRCIFAWWIYNFVETPCKCFIVKLISTDEDPILRIGSTAKINLCGVNFHKIIFTLYYYYYYMFTYVN